MHRKIAVAAAVAMAIAIAAMAGLVVATMAADRSAEVNQALRQLDWMVGDWVDEGPEAIVTAHYRWSPDGRTILGEFHVHADGRAALTGTQRIAWDPLLKKVHSWLFDSQGGFSQGIWTRRGDAWVVATMGTTGDGRHSSATITATREGSDRAVWRFADRVVGTDVLSQVDEIHLVRAPPQPVSSNGQPTAPRQ